MAYLVQFRRDTIDNWQSVNPIIADGEFIIVRTSDNAHTIGYKTGNGKDRFNDLEYNSNASYVEEFGEGHTVSLSQYYTSQITTEYNVSYFHFNEKDASREFTLAEAIVLVPEAVRKVGLKITFLSSDSKNWETWQNTAIGFTNVNNWQNTQEVSDVIQPPANLESGDYLYNIFYHPTTGVKTYEPSRLTTNFIQVDDGQILTYKIYGYASSIAIAAFDAKKDILLDKCIITSSLTGEEGQYVVDSSVKFLRITRLNNATGLNQTASFYKADYQPIIEESFEGIKRLFLEDFSVKGMYLHPITGREYANPSWNSTPFIPVVKGEFIYYSSLYGTTGAAIIAFYDKTKLAIETTRGDTTYEAKVIEVPENAAYVRFCNANTISPCEVQIISGISRNQYIGESKGELIVDCFDQFTLVGLWERNGKELRNSGGGFTQSKFFTETFEDEFVMSCRLQATATGTDSVFEAGIGKISSTPGYVDRWVTLRKGPEGSSLRTYYRTDGSYQEQTNVRQFFSRELELNKWYVLQLIKTTGVKSALIAKLYDETSGELLASFTTNTAAYAWGCPTLTNIAGTWRFSDFTMSYPKNAYPLVAVYGDSFIEGDTIRDTKNLRYSALLQEVIGKGNCLLFGHGGASTKSDNSRTLLQLQKVNSAYAILAYGNNDADWDTWWKYMEYMLRLCKSTDTVPIFVTVTPRVGQSDAYIAKINAINNWIKSSGYSYIDANKACTTDGLTWKSGYVMDDGVHPTVLGHKAIFDRIKIDCPFLIENEAAYSQKDLREIDQIQEELLTALKEVPFSDKNSDISLYLTDNVGTILGTISKKGEVAFSLGGFAGEKHYTIQRYTGVIKVLTDNKGSVIGYIDDKGKVHIQELEVHDLTSTDIQKLLSIVAFLSSGVENHRVVNDKTYNLLKQNPGVYKKPGVPVETVPMIVYQDDDAIDNQIPTSNMRGADENTRPTYTTQGGYASVLWPVIKALNVRYGTAINAENNRIVCGVAAEGQRTGLTALYGHNDEFTGKLNPNGEYLKKLVNHEGWEVMCHSMTARYIAQSYLVNGLTSDFANQVLQAGNWAGDLHWNTTTCYDTVTKKNYQIKEDKSGWDELPKAYIKPYCAVSLEANSLLVINPTYSVEYQVGTWFDRADIAGLPYLKKIGVNWGDSHSIWHMRESLKYADLMFARFSDYNTIPTDTNIHRFAYYPSPGRNGVTNNTEYYNVYTEVEYKRMTDVIDNCIANKGLLVLAGHTNAIESYNYYWPYFTYPTERTGDRLNYRDDNYNIEWRVPLNYDELKTMDENNYWEVPPARLGISNWGEYYPCPGTTMALLYDSLRYAISKGVRFASSKEAIEKFGNLMSIGLKNDHADFWVADARLGDIEEQDKSYCVIGADGSIDYKS